MATTSDLEKGMTIRKENKLWFVMSTFFVSPGKGSAFYKVKLKEVQTGKVVDYTLKSGEAIEIVDTERKTVQFLYKQDDLFVFMDQENYEQYSLEESVVGEKKAAFLKEEQKLIIFFAEEVAVDVSYVKQKQVFEVIEAPPGVKGDTVSNAFKTVSLETGAKAQVPLFIKEGEKVVINVETGEYCERMKS